MSKKEPGSKHFLKAQQKYWKAINKKINKKNWLLPQNHTQYSKKKQLCDSTRNAQYKKVGLKIIDGLLNCREYHYMRYYGN